jgi:hypothetical protein
MNFEDIPHEDIKYFLSYYNQPLSNNIYLQAWNFILSNPQIKVPKSIADWLNNFKYTNIIKTLPTELVFKISEDLDCNDILSLCTSFNKFDDVCSEQQLVKLLKESLSKDTYVENINSKNRLISLCKFKHLNKRICMGIDQQGQHVSYIVGNDGKVYLYRMLYDEYENEQGYGIEQLQGVENIVSLLYDNNTRFFFLRNDGKVYEYNTNEEEYAYIPILIPDLDNVVQIGFIQGVFYFLTEDGKVFIFNDEEIVLKSTNVSEVVANDYLTFYLQNNGAVELNKRILFKNVKKLITATDGSHKILLVTLDNNNVINVYETTQYVNDTETPKNTFTLPNKIKKIEVSASYFRILNDGAIWILDDKGILYLVDFKKNIITEIFQNVVDFDSKRNHTYILTNDKFILYRTNGTKKIIKGKGKIKLLGNQLLTIDGVLYLIDEEYLSTFNDYSIESDALVKVSI